MYKLVIQDDEGKTTVVPLIRDELTIGRKEGNTIRLTERNVSRRHARVMRSNGSITIEDLDSYNGIRVNGSRIAGSTNLNESDRVQIGDYLIEIKSEAAQKAGGDDTQRMDRVDPLGHTPIPDVAAGAATIPTPSPVAEMDMDNALTTPVVSTKSAPAPEAAAQTATPARLVVLSTNYAGREFELDQPAIVIGRTDENDIWINHRSISRHHAKIVRENGRYAIVDLQSSNGVRVNGEEYGKVELRRADVIDLGHVRMRFVEAGEDFVFGRDAQAIEIEPEDSGHAGLWALLALIVIAGGVALFMMNRNGASESSQGGAAVIIDAGTRMVQTPGTGMDAAAEVDDTRTKATELLKKASAAIQAEEWAKAHELSREALGIAPDSTEALRLSEQAKAELRASAIYMDFAACKRNEYVCITSEFNKLESDSVYRARAQAKYDDAKRQFITEKDAEGRRLAQAGKCDEQRRLAQAAARIWTDAAATVRRHRCRAQGGSTTTPPPDDPPPPVKPPPKSSEELKREFDTNLAEATAAYKQYQYTKALRQCEAALRIRSSSQATMVCALAACGARLKSKARRYYSKVREGQKSAVQQQCLAKGTKVQ